MTKESFRLSDDDPEPWPVAIFAHNEAENITKCLDSLPAAAPGQRIAAFVLANGCTDDTEEIVANYARARDDVHLVHIDVGDKCNAWNEFVHLHAPRSRTLFFIDGDVRAAPGALEALQRGLDTHPEANAAAALPGSGRSQTAFRRMLIDEGGVAGNLYALRGRFADRIRDAGIRLPIGLVGDDGLVGTLAHNDLDPRKGDWSRARVVTCPDAMFVFDPLSLWRPDHWRLYWRRQINYAVRARQFRMLAPLIHDGGVRTMPASVRDLYAARAEAVDADTPWPTSLFDLLARNRIRRATPPGS